MEIPAIRLKKAIKEGKTFLKEFRFPELYASTKDIFCLQETRKIDGYNQVIWDNNKIKVPVFLSPGTEIELHIIPDEPYTEVRLWYKGSVLKVIKYKNKVQF